MTKPKCRGKFLNNWTIKSTRTTIEVGNTVLIRPENPNDEPYVGQVQRIQSGTENVMVKVRWYYRPEDTHFGRSSFNGEKELFLSDDLDKLSVETIIDKCTVHSFKQYTSLECAGPQDYFCRLNYNSARKSFIPATLPVYCKCLTPINPDKLMVQCENDKCEDEWFHPECLNLSIEQVNAMEHFYCPDCTEEDYGKMRTQTSSEDCDK